jgi:undecaprenyl diphosphate synthase
MTSTLPESASLHVAIIMDGNGRWAMRRGLPRTVGHRAGVEAVRRVVESAPDLGIGTLTLFAFSAANWRRPPEEIAALMRLLHLYLRAETRRFAESGARLTVIGRRDRLRPGLVREIEATERATAEGQRLHVRVALDYSSRESIARAAARCAADSSEALDRFGQLVSQSTAGEPGSTDVDLLIRTGGEQRLSDFLLWESAFAELWFTDQMWPEFGAEDLRAAVLEFHRRERRFGGLGSAPPETATPRLATG